MSPTIPEENNQLNVKSFGANICVDSQPSTKALYTLVQFNFRSQYLKSLYNFANELVTTFHRIKTGKQS